MLSRFYANTRQTQTQLLHTLLESNEAVYQVISRASCLGLDRYYIGAGCIAQTVWNHQNGLSPMYGIADIDFVYFDDDLTYEAENEIIKRVQTNLADCPVPIDVKNQARVHLWYQSAFGYELPPYKTLEDAIKTWPTTATAIGVRLDGSNLSVYAPFGLDDLFGQIIRANKAQITKETYEKKCRNWTEKWNTLTVIPW